MRMASAFQETTNQLIGLLFGLLQIIVHYHMIELVGKRKFILCLSKTIANGLFCVGRSTTKTTLQLSQ